MTPFPEKYAGIITRIEKRIDGTLSLWFWAKREGFITEILCASPEIYTEEFPGKPIEVTPWPYLTH